jgi:hypothetical protein
MFFSATWGIFRRMVIDLKYGMCNSILGKINPVKIKIESFRNGFFGIID